MAYATVWKVIFKDKRTEITFAPILYVDAVADIADNGANAFNRREDRSIENGETRLVAMDTEFGPPSKEVNPNEEVDMLNWLHAVTQDQQAKMAEVAEVQISLDAAIFSNGLLVGPDSSDLDRDFNAKLETKQRLYRQIVSDLDAGRAVDEAFGPAKTLAVQRPAPSRNPLAIYETIAAQEIVALRKRIGDSAVPVVFGQAIRKEPFVIRKSSTN